MTNAFSAIVAGIIGLCPIPDSIATPETAIITIDRCISLPPPFAWFLTENQLCFTAKLALRAEQPRTK